MSVAVGDTVRITEGAADVLARNDVGLSVGDEVTVTGLAEDNFFAMLLGAPEGAIFVKANNPNNENGTFGLEQGEFELVAA